MPEEVNYPAENLNWWTSVTHTDGETEVAQVKQFTNYRPFSLEDIPVDENGVAKKVILTSRKWSRPPKDKEYKVYVTNIAETKEDLKKNLPKTRVRLPPLVPLESDILTSESEVERRRKKEAKEKERAVRKQRTRQTEELDYGKMLESLPKTFGSTPSSSTLQDDINKSSTSAGSTCTLSSKSQSQVLSPKNDQLQFPVKPFSMKQKFNKPIQAQVINNVTIEQVQNAVGLANIAAASKSQSPFNLHDEIPVEYSNIKITPQDVGDYQTAQILYACSESEKDAEIQSLKVKLEALRAEKDILLQEKQQRKLNPSSEVDLIQKISTVLAAELKKLPNREDFSKLEKRVTNIEESIKNCEWSSRGSTCQSHSSSLKSSSSGKRHTEEVHLGLNVFITETAYLVMSNTSDVDEFAEAFLLGVLREEAKRYRLHPRNDENMKFPEAFQSVAKAEYGKFLSRIGHKPPYPKKTLRTILTLMSRKATDLNGRRNKSSLDASSSCKKRKTDGSVEREAVLDSETGLMVYEADDGEHEASSGEEEED